MRVIGIDQSRLSPERARAVADLLSPAETHRLEAQPSRHKGEWTAGRLALKLAAAPHCGKQWHQVDTGHAPSGQPRILEAPALHCSLSHSGPLAVAAVGRSAVGVDVEWVRPRNDALLRYIACRDEVDLVPGSEVDGGLVTGIWTIKEAALKCGGWGLSIPPRAVRILRRVGRMGFEVKLTWRAVELDLTVWSASVRGCSLSVATNEPDPFRGILWDPAFVIPTR